MKVEEYRNNFPGLETESGGRTMVYLDNAATSQRCAGTIERLRELEISHNANVHRSVYTIASDATKVYEDTREYVKKYINAPSREEIVFTSGATFSLNLVAFSWGEKHIKSGDNILVCVSEHHSNLVPWQLLAQRKGAEIKVIPVDERGEIIFDEYERLFDDRTRLVCVAQISNVLGIVAPVKEMIRIAHDHGVLVLVDGAQGIVHAKVDVQDMDCDFYAFSGHKIFAATGTGVLYARKSLLMDMDPFLSGGEMIGNVSFEKTTFADIPYKFEAGTPNFNSIPTLKDGIEILRLGMEDEELRANLSDIKEYVYGALNENSDIRILGMPRDMSRKIPLFSIVVKGVHHEDLAILLDKMGVAARSGHACAEPLMDRFGITGMLRVSFAPYNTMEEAEYFIRCLDRAIKMLS